MVDIRVANGKITEIGTGLKVEDEVVFKARGLTILPGMIDTQVHFREPGFPLKEDLATGSQAAVMGGVTAVFEMPNTKPPTVTKLDLLDKLDRARGRMFCNHAFYVGATAENYSSLPELETMPGCAGVKIFMGSSTGNLLLDDADILYKVLQITKRRPAVHSEDDARLTERKKIAENSKDVKDHPVWRDEETALISTKRLVGFAEKLNRRVHVLHVTSAEEMQFLREKKTWASVETSPQHLFFSAPDCYERLGTFAQMNPPIRSRRHQEAVWQAVLDGTVDVLGSDHAPHTIEEKKLPYPASPSGMPGVQTILPVMLDFVAKNRLPLSRVVELLSERPASLFGIKGKGKIEVGMDADLTVVDLGKSWTIENRNMKSRCGWTPFDGVKVTGYPAATIIGGQVVMRDGELIGRPIGRPLEFSF